jgi:hypothetical protein
LHRLRVLLPQPCAALDVGEEKAYHVLRQIRCVEGYVFYSIRHIVMCERALIADRSTLLTFRIVPAL